MRNTSPNRNLLFIIVALVLTNIAVLVYFLAIKKDDKRSGRPPQSGRGMHDVLEKEVGFNSAQVAEYKTMREQQIEKSRPLFDEMRKAKDSLFRLLSDTTASDSVISQAADRIAARQKMLDLETFNHFRRVRTLCTNADQQIKYDSAVLRMFRKMGKPKTRGEDSKKD